MRSLALAALLALAPAALLAQGDSTASPWMRFRISQPLPALKIPPIYRSPWASGPRLSPARVGAAWQDSVRQVLDSQQIARLTALRLRRIYGRKAVLEGPEQEAQGEAGAAQSARRGTLGLDRRYADLSLNGAARLEIRSDKTRNLRCNAYDLLDPRANCRGGFKAPRLDTQLQLRSFGVIGRRVNVAVDYDSERDFQANNDIKVFYEGLEDEPVRRIEVGTVQFRPPPSQFLTAAIPANNFGVSAEFQVGALQLQTIVATQKGSQVAERNYTVGQTTTQPEDRQVRDLDFESGRFFWVVDPANMPGYPAVDILNLTPSLLPPGGRPSPGNVRIYRYRPSLSALNANIGGISAVARRGDTPLRVGPLKSAWQLMLQGSDYYLDPSGLWFVLSAKLDQGDYLAVSYVTAAGDSVGTFPASDNPAGNDSLELIQAPRVGPSEPTFRYEMRNVYQVAGLDLDRNTLKLDLSLNRSQTPLGGGAATYLALFGLALQTDATSFDVVSRLFPRAQDAGAQATLPESYIVFPNLQPFADPNRLTAAERSDSLYRTPDYLLFSQGPPARFGLRLRYVASGGGDRSSLDLNALSVRSGSERITVNGRVLERGTDYSIDYNVGKVNFLNPNDIFGTGQATVNVRFEERGVFAVAPTQLFGMSSSYSLGGLGSIGAVAFYQREQTAFSRPPLGFEATANLVAGLTSDLHFKPAVLTRLFNKLTSTPSTAPSLLDLRGEVAMSRPDPNRSGQAYLEEFEGDFGTPIGLRETAWEFGSAPHDASGVTDAGITSFATSDAVQLTWQNLVPDNLGGVAEFRPRDIDPTVQISNGTDVFETVLFMTLHADTSGGVVIHDPGGALDGHSRWTQTPNPGRPRWRSMTTALSAAGVDLSKSEFLEFWVFQRGDHSADSADVRLMVDLGSVDEDAVGLAPHDMLVAAGDTTFTGRQLVGLGKLDSERQPSGIFNAETDDRGILGDRPDTLGNGVPGETFPGVPLCRTNLSATVQVYRWGDLSARCTRGNGQLNTEDLNGDNLLNLGQANPREDVFRWVVRLNDPTYFVRDGGKTPDGLGGWKLYRIPLRTPQFTLGSPNARLIQQLRITAVAPPAVGPNEVVGRFALARMRLLGSPWVRRSDAPVHGLAGATGNPQGTVVASIVSTENTELGYTSPPGVLAQRPKAGDVGSTLQINERSLRVVATGLGVGDRAEAYTGFQTGRQNLLKYERLRAWVRGHGNGWVEGDYKAFIRVGTDNSNFYQYLADARSDTWVPEVVVELSTWRALRLKVENRYLSGLPADSVERVACGGDTISTAYVSCSGRYLVYVGNPAVAPPNLAAVQELSAGILRVGTATSDPSAELWVDDIRVTDPISDVGVAMAFDARLVASDVGDVQLSYVRQDGRFQQLGRDPTYRTSGGLRLGTTLRLDRFLPASLGIAMPVSFGYARRTEDPELLSGSDVLAQRLSGLRRPEGSTYNYGLVIRRTARGKSWLTRGLVDPLSMSASYTHGHDQSDLTRANSSSYAVQLQYGLQPGRVRVELGLEGLVDHLPGFIRRSLFGQGLRRPALNLAPSSVRLGSGLTRQENVFRSFLLPVNRPADSLVLPVLALTHVWRNSAGTTWQPLGMLNLSADLSSARDLRQYGDSTTLGRVATQERRQLAGLDVGVEAQRTLTTSLLLTPKLTSWLQPRFSTTSSFALTRNLTGRDPIREIGDTAGAFLLAQTLFNQRIREIGTSVDIARLIGQIFGLPPAKVSTIRIRPVDIRQQLVRNSTFDLTAFSPSLGYQLGFGGLGSFLSREGEQARAAQEGKTTTLTVGADLPLGFSITSDYSRSRTTRFQAVSSGFLATETFQRQWPSGSLRWSRTINNGPVRTLGVGVQIQNREAIGTQPLLAGTVVKSITQSHSWTPDFQLGLHNGITVTGSYGILDQLTSQRGSRTEFAQRNLSGNISYSFEIPGKGTQSRRLRTSASALRQTITNCLQIPGRNRCDTLADSRRQEYRAGLDTEFSQMLSGGLQFSYAINEQRDLSQKNSQMILMATLQLSLFAGDYR